MTTSERGTSSDSINVGSRTKADGCQGDPAAIDLQVGSAARLLKSWRRVLVTSHRNPDGDALGAALGLALALRASGREVVVVNADPPIEAADVADGRAPSRAGLAGVPGADLLVRWEDLTDADFDGAVLVDCSTPDRLHRDPAVPRRALERIGGLVVIDHHLTSVGSGGSEGGDPAEASGAVRVVDASRASSAELVWLVIESAGLPVDRDVATALLTGVATDTKGFLRDSSDGRALAVASRLRELGGEVSVASDILDRHSVGFLTLAGTALSRSTIIAGGAGIVASVPRGLIEASGAGDADLERLTALLSGTREARVVVLLQELAGEIRGSVRTQPPLDAVAIAKRFGGGGHARRAGFRLPGVHLETAGDEAAKVIRELIEPVEG